MAGGSGTRLWPASSSKKPKQFLPAGNDKTKTFFSLSLERAFKAISKDTGRVIIITGKDQLAHVIEACSALDGADKKRLVIIPEPLSKNTAPAIACAIAYSRLTSGLTSGFNRSMLVLTSDHIIKPLGVFKKDAVAAFQFTKKGNLVVFGVTPSRPETGYGYIEAPVKLSENVHEVVKFHEKPDQETAEKYIATGRFFWNLGMFAFDCGFMEKEFLRVASPVFRPFERLRPPCAKSYTKTKQLRVLSGWEGLEKAYREAKKIAFDYAVTSHCARIAMVRCGFEWADVGSWDEYASIAAGKAGGASKTGVNVYTAGDCGGNFVDSDVPVALVGVSDLIVVIRSGKDGSPQTALIAKKGETQRVRDIVEQLKKEGKTENL
jgi:mannose-1-phosphate guanylyltransferase/mannose-1-phosphate guanylyltransferase/mannose-6-phosphate isomerase